MNERNRTAARILLTSSFILTLLCALPADAQNRSKRNSRTEDYFGAKHHFHPRRNVRPENRHPVVILRFRTINGSQNNLVMTNWGMQGVNLRRRVLSAYEDGLSAPSGSDRPSARFISNMLCDQTESMPNARGLTSMVWQWGQFLDHDIDLTESHEPSEPFFIPVPKGDIFFDPFETGTQQIFLFRSHYRTGLAAHPREQINSITSWIDGSNVYGSDVDTARSLRTLSGGLMRTSDGDLLPMDEDGFFLAGDVRANEQVGLISMHTLFVREHNRIARRLAQLNPRLNDEQIYLRARKRVVAIMQSITYNEFLPALFGPHALSPYRGYRPEVNPNISNVFSTAAYRFGHTMLPTELLRLDANGDAIPDGNLSLAEAFFNPQEVRTHGIDPYLRGLIFQQAQEIDTHIITDVRNFLFGIPGSGGFDLAALNIQRGRDHGLADYNTVRQFFGLPAIKTFEEMTRLPDKQFALVQTYGDVNNIDPWVGMLSEDPLPGSSLGPTLQVILRQQFQMLRDADRFWYELDLPQRDVETIRNTRLSNVIRRNTGVRKMPGDVFRLPQ